jgi:tRNA threonylcarbamoyladenosine biosynthesis protein TsaB
MSLILNIESATDICSVAISQNTSVLALKETKGNDHAANITLLIKACLEETKTSLTDLKAVAVSHGPGSYTSLRVGASTAKGICYALDIPLLVISTLEALALAAYHEVGDANAYYCAMIDARRMEVYTSTHAVQEANNFNLVETTRPLVIEENSFEHLFHIPKKVFFAGNGVTKVQGVVKSELANYLNIECSAQHLPPLSMAAYLKQDFYNIAEYTPHYLKPPNITVSKKMNLLTADLKQEKK